MSIQAVKGTRDFYPELMRRRNWIMAAWRRVSLRNGFEEYDAPIFEYPDLFTTKSGPEIASQLFNLVDRGGRSLAIRPEITPSLARMVNAKISSLPRPIKWFSMPRLCRAENTQRGRLREFFQWNVDVIGSDEVIADAEGIYTAVDFLREVGLTPADVTVRIGSRALTVSALKAAGLSDESVQAALPVLDKRAKVSDEEFRRLAVQAGMSGPQIESVCRFQDCDDLGALAKAAGGSSDGEAAVEQLRQLLATLRAMGAGEYCTLDMRIVRGLAYYTGVVYEVFDAAGSMRAVAGGGRYDNLLEVLGGPKVGATGFGMGDVVLGLLLEEKAKFPADVDASSVDYYLIDAEETCFPRVVELVGGLRGRGASADFSYARRAVGKQLKEANRRGARFAVIVREDGVSVKELATGEQRDVTAEEFLASAEGSQGNR
ncbi:MAG: histidine--tRNA ligase [Planctomycetota bacterium]|nr:histidine--tRNA ligase [Planctomycetota bacterium]